MSNIAVHGIDDLCVALANVAPYKRLMVV